MFKTLMEYAGTYEPLTRCEELALIEKCSGNPQILLQSMIKFNSRYLIKQIMKWRGTYPSLDDITGLVILAITESFDDWDFKTSFVYHIKYKVMSKLHANIPKRLELHANIEDYVEDSADTSIIDKGISDDLQSDLKELLTTQEYNFIFNIYFNHMSVKQAGSIAGYTSNPSKSRKLHQILDKLARHLDITDWL